MRNAIRHYELSGTHHREVPRMLFEVGQIDNLGRYVKTKDDPILYKWWGQYCEYRGTFPFLFFSSFLAPSFVPSLLRSCSFLVGSLKIERKFN